MAVRYVPIDGEVVSAEWHAVLADMRADGVWFNVNEGKRTMERQWHFWNLFKHQNGNVAAYPSPTAPHIREGQIDHAIDFDNDAGVFAWLTAHGLEPARTVSSESWHIECPARALSAYAATHGPNAQAKILQPLGRAQRQAAARLLYHRRQAIAEAMTGKGPRYRRAVAWRRFWHRRAELLRSRARGERAAILERVLKDKDGWIDA